MIYCCVQISQTVSPMCGKQLNLQFTNSMCELAHLHTVDTWEFREITILPFCVLLFVCFVLSDPAAEPHVFFSVGCCTHRWVNWTADLMCKYSRTHYFIVFLDLNIYVNSNTHKPGMCTKTYQSQIIQTFQIRAGYLWMTLTHFSFQLIFFPLLPFYPPFIQRVFHFHLHHSVFLRLPHFQSRCQSGSVSPFTPITSQSWSSLNPIWVLTITCLHFTLTRLFIFLSQDDSLPCLSCLFL